MAHYDITNFDGADIIDVRDVIARVEELRESVDGEVVIQDEYEELKLLEGLLSDLCGYGGDEQWEGDWHPVTLINEDYFEKAMYELLEDCGDLPKNLLSYLTITVDYDALKQDYSSVEFEGNTYYYR